MLPFDRRVRAEIYRHLAAGGSGPAPADVAAACEAPAVEVAAAFRRLEEAHRIVLLPDEPRVWMAHPFSGVPTGFTATVGDTTWSANCAWDALGIVTLMGDGRAECPLGADRVTWKVADGRVTPEGGVVHVQVPARHFWDDIGFT